MDLVGWRVERLSVYLTNLGILVSWGAAAYLMGLADFFLVHGPILFLGSVIVMWFFLVQHTHERSYWRADEHWDFVDAALIGSSYYKLPGILQWLSASVGLHHVHHLAPRIPNYHLQRCLDEIPELGAVAPLSRAELRRILTLALWDEDSRRMVTIREAERCVARPFFERARTALTIAGFHVIPLFALVSPDHDVRAEDWIACLALYLLGVFAVGVCLHRYFTHKSFDAGRVVHVILAWLACTVFTDPIGFCGKHRLHHRHSDTPRDVHSPRSGFWQCWIGSLIDEGYSDAEIMAMAPDLCADPALVWLHRHLWVPGVALAALVYALGGFTMFAVGFCLSRAMVLHATSAVNYVCHRIGSQPFATRDDSRNNRVVALLTLGEGWHNNHHRFPGSARSGMGRWQIDPCYWSIALLSRLRVVRNVRVTNCEVAGRDTAAGRFVASDKRR